jgi:DNA-binding beta-propeller fold protein YncE
VNFIGLTANTVSFTLRTDPSINPAGIAITPDGTRAYVTSFNNINSVILVIDIASHAIMSTIPAAAWPQGAFVTPDGSQLWVSYPFGNEVDVFDTLTNTQSTARSVNAPSGIAFNSSGTRAYVASGGTPGTLVEFDTATFQKLTSYTVGSYPVDVNVLPGGRFVIVNNFGSGNLSIVDTATGKVASGPSGAASLGLMRIY